jgi:2-deoxy-D-gluconate 3-dehydrogenase
MQITMVGMEDTLPRFRTNGFDLSDRVAIVTGASRGIGASAAAALDRAGCRVALVSRSEEHLQGVAEGLKNDPLVVPSDISNADEPARVVEAVERAAGRVDILVNNAGVTNLSSAMKMDVATWDTATNINLRAAFLFAQAAGRGMIERRSGKIVNVASIIAFSGDAMAAAYTATKTGMVGLTRALAVEWAKRGIQVNALCPGWVDTELTSGLRSNEAFEQRVIGSVPQGRWGDPGDMDGPIVFLSSAASDFMTGQTLVVDGGLLSRW